ncbi:hypothetical protein PROFUN_02693 [Planoprotostelium fungivorum]|uniref:Uncharacterized protein n=1 Tax=Planoprotostelium fungivorum TaxID=1890364 RepID=A0A2P6NVJ7_9EUKA|nr:hypothetical protein PROFUN_02693 [Planoprotostelium fungivorum]
MMLSEADDDELSCSYDQDQNITKLDEEDYGRLSEDELLTVRWHPYAKKTP